jgi:hypothetical protein
MLVDRTNIIIYISFCSPIVRPELERVVLSSVSLRYPLFLSLHLGLLYLAILRGTTSKTRRRLILRAHCLP